MRALIAMMIVSDSSGAKSPILGFYAGESPDDCGRYLAEIPQWPDERLEAVHDYIQWLFPLREPSNFNPEAPVLDAKTIRQFRSRVELKENLRTSFLRMLKFYGLEMTADPTPKIARAGNFEQRSRNWLSPMNHNHLRITRIIKSLRLLGLEAEASAFFDCLNNIYAEESAKPRPRITLETYQYWQAATRETA